MILMLAKALLAFGALVLAAAYGVLFAQHQFTHDAALASGGRLALFLAVVVVALAVGI